ncbi:MAG: hypothetical protein HYZ79_00435 [Candidatus Melainabacteria bacterium]|nr:hypothetical protein [Candidatus Melainabacteria bacterium]
MRLILSLFLVLILFGAGFSLAKEYSDFATPSELIIKKQIFPNSWQKLNGPFGGQGYTIRFDPSNSKKIIVTDSFVGIHISEDGGLTWKESNTGIDARTGGSGDSIPVFVVTIDPNNTQRFWCGVKNAMGVFLSQDGGMTWEHKDNGLPNGSEVEIRGLAVKPGDSNTIFAAGDLEEIGPFTGAFQRTEGIVYRTIDGGENWEKVLEGGNLFKDIIIDPNSPNTIYVASGFFDRHELENLEGVHKSTDGGNTWQKINSGIRNLYVTTIKFDPTNSNTIWGTTGMIPQFADSRETEDGGIIKSIDGGMTWAEIKRGRNSSGTQLYSALGISETDPNVIYASGFGLFTQSSDGGKTWIETGFGPRGTNAGHPIDIAVDPNDPNTVYVDSYVGGVFKSTDEGKTWVTNAFGYSGSEVSHVTVAPDNKKIFATSRTGIFLSEDKGINWTPVGIGDVGFDELFAVTPHPTDSNILLLGDGLNALGSIFRSIDGGMTWKTVFMLLQEHSPFVDATDITGPIAFTEIKFAKSNPNVVFAASVKHSLEHLQVDSIGHGLFKSIDAGKTWVKKNSGLTGFMNTWDVAIDPNDENIVYTVTNDSGIYKSTDGGENFTRLLNGLEDKTSFYSISINPTNSQIILAGSQDGEILRSLDAGNSWAKVLDFRNFDNINDIEFNPQNPNQAFAGATATGFYVSNDSGATWEQFNDGLTGRKIEDISVPQDGSAVYLTAYGGGVFRLPLVGGSLILTRQQVEIPSNAGIDGIDNALSDNDTDNPSEDDPNDTDQNNDLPFEVSGSALNGIIFGKKPSKNLLLIELIENSGVDQMKIKLSSNLPSQVLKIAPIEFSLNSTRNSKQVKLITKPAKKLIKTFGANLPSTLVLNIEGIVEGNTITSEVEIPISVEN